MNQKTMWGMTFAMGAALAGCGVPAAEEFTFSPEKDHASGAVSLSGVTRSFSSALATVDTPVGDASVCAMLPEGTPRCVTSAADGSWSLDGLPPNERLVVTFEKKGFVPMLRVIATTTTSSSPSDAEAGLIADANAPALLGAGNASKGRVWFAVSGDEHGGARVAATLSPSVAAPTYVDAAGTAIAGATSGTHGVFANLDAGDYSVRFSGVGCGDGANDALGGSATPSVVVRDGFVTGPVLASCNGEQ